MYIYIYIDIVINSEILGDAGHGLETKSILSHGRALQVLIFRTAISAMASTLANQRLDSTSAQEAGGTHMYGIKARPKRSTS